jgi:hypothetical protein
MYTCNHCKNKFYNEPYISCTNSKKYCCLKCLPENGIDKPYSFEYFNLIDSLREISPRVYHIKTLEDRLGLERDVNELHQSYSILIYGDNEGLFYKKQIAILLSTLNELYSKIHNIFINHKYIIKPSIIIYCEELINLVGEETFFLSLNKFKEVTRHIPFENIDNPDPVKDTYLGFYRIKLCTDSLNSAKQLKKIFNKCLNNFGNNLTQEQLEELKENDYHVTTANLYQCVVCREWEMWEDYSFNKSLKVYQCNSWSKCCEYDDYYDVD